MHTPLCDELGIIIDLSHMNAKGFDDVARLSRKPLVATHSNAHAVTPSTRNLTDRQLDMIRDTGGMVGLNFSCDGSHYMPWHEFLRKSLGFWLGTGEACA